MPSSQLFAGVDRSHEPVRVQTLRSQLAVERLDEPIVRGLAWPREVQRDLIGISPQANPANLRHNAIFLRNRNGKLSRSISQREFLDARHRLPDVFQNRSFS